ncbi:MAG: cation diffusion facilitator family transporter [Erysipelotrichaceae bacterium]|nr:cation diffusion facilitator family transporter [Erysipelotrichaceae bacterium]
MSTLTASRNDQIIRYNIFGIVMNVSFSIIKIMIGTLYSAHAMILDGVNGFSDALSYLLSIVSSFLNKKGATKNLPMGYGRMEYLLSLTTTILVTYVGFRSIFEAIYDITHPHEAPQYNILIIVIAIVSLIAKSYYGIILRNKGTELKSMGMVMSGTDSICDSFVSLAILIAVVVYQMTGADIEHYLCIVIALLIIFTGLKMLRECMNKILGTRVDPEFRKRIVNMVIQEKDVQNVSNLVIHNYGENVYVGSLDIEVDPNMKALRITELSRKLISKADKLGLKLTSVGIIASKVNDPKADQVYDQIIDKVIEHKGIIRIHSFSIDFKKKQMSFYIVFDYSVKDKEKEKTEFLKEIQEMYPKMKIRIYTGVDL